MGLKEERPGMRNPAPGEGGGEAGGGRCSKQRKGGGKGCYNLACDPEGG